MTENATETTETTELATELTPEQEDVLEALRDVVDPELGINVVDLGLVYGLDIDADRIATIDMTLTSAACPLTDVIEEQARDALDGVVADFRINWVWMPPWGPENITEALAWLIEQPSESYETSSTTCSPPTSLRATRSVTSSPHVGLTW